MCKKFIYKIATDWFWPMWSNFRWRKVTRHNIGIKQEDHIQNFGDIQRLVMRLYDNFEWTRDSIDQLWDSMCPPPYNYERYLKGVLKDDCDGFHALVYHCLFNCDINCCLLAVESPKGSHCVLLFKYGDKWYVNDYRTLYGSYKSPQEAVDAYNKIYPKKYNHDAEVINDGFIKYDYNKGKFYSISINDLE